MILRELGMAKERANVVPKALIHETGRRGAEIPQFLIEGRPSLCGDPAEGASESKKITTSGRTIAQPHRDF